MSAGWLLFLLGMLWGGACGMTFGYWAGHRFGYHDGYQAHKDRMAERLRARMMRDTEREREQAAAALPIRAKTGPLGLPLSDAEREFYAQFANRAPYPPARRPHPTDGIPRPQAPMMPPQPSPEPTPDTGRLPKLTDTGEIRLRGDNLVAKIQTGDWPA